MMERLIPERLRRVLGRIRANWRAQRIGRMDLPAAFDEIYKKAYWRQGESLSGVGSEGLWADLYCAAVEGLVSQYGFQYAVDAGCGDFRVGQQLAPLFQKYYAVDVSSFIIQKNILKFSDLPNVEFRQVNLVEQLVPRVDLIMIRQVMQHLTNQQISAILENFRLSGSAYLLVAEENPSKPFLPNKDLASHSVLTRIDIDSGVDVSSSPFGLKGKSLHGSHRRPATKVSRFWCCS
jgi:SAM-dependent methyltransferase